MKTAARWGVSPFFKTFIATGLALLLSACGGGGGSGIISGSWTNTVSQNGQNGTGGGRSAVDTGDPDYVSGYGGSGQHGLVVLTFE